MENFQSNIQQWVSLDNDIKTLNNRIKILRDDKNRLHSNIIRFAEVQNLNNAQIEISDGKLAFANVKVQQPLTYKYLEEKLPEIIKDKDQVKYIISYLKQNREVKENKEIKRYYNN